MVDSARSTCEKQLRGFCGIQSAVHTGESAWYVGVSQDLFDRSTLDRLVVVDTSAVADVAVPCMSRIQWFGGGQSLDPQDAKLCYVVG